MTIKRMSRGSLARPTLTREHFDRVAKALADPRRVSLLEAIAAVQDDEFPCQRLCQEFPVSKATISHHVKELLRAGLIEARREGQYMFYHVRRDVLETYAEELLRRAGGGRPQ